MRKLLNTLYVTTPDAYIKKDGLNIVITVEQEERLRIPVANIEGIVTFGYMGVSPGAMKLCADTGVSLTFLSPNGRFIGRFQGPTKGNVLLRRRQYELASQPEFCLHLARLFIAAKIKNYRTILMRCQRDNGTCEPLQQSIGHLDNNRKIALRASSIESLRGIEGDAAGEYFSVFSHLIVAQKNDFPFNGRNRRPPRDAVNAMLSFAYSLIASDVAAALETVGLDPYVGFMHTLRPGRTSLALDLMEELRAYLGDRLVLSLINRQQITPRHFVPQGENTITMTDDGRRIFIKAWQTRKREEVLHPFLEEKIPIGLIPYAQSMLLARMLRGDIDNYPVYLIK